MDNITVAIDVGRSRVGVAKLIEQSSIIEPIGAFNRAGGVAERELIKLFNLLSVKIIIAGMPLNADGSEGSLCGDIRRFCKRLLRRYQASLVYVDEYGSSIEAQERLRTYHDKGMIDAQSAVIILERYTRQEGIVK